MNAQFAVGKLICDHINFHLGGPEPQDHVIKMAEIVPLNGGSESEFIALISKLSRLLSVARGWRRYIKNCAKSSKKGNTLNGN